MGVVDAVVPVAGLGTRLLPATKSQPKEMLPVVGKPVVQYVVEELAAAGIERILFVTGRGKSAIEDHFDPDPDLIRRLRETGKEELLAELEYERMGVDFLYTRQAEPRGLGDAVACAERFAADRPFALALGDSILAGGARSSATNLLAEALEEREAVAAIAVEEIEPAQARLRGVVIPAGRASDGPFDVAGMIEKPAELESADAIAVAARYVLTPPIFEALRGVEPDASGEIQLTDAIAILIDAGERVVGVRLPEGMRRHDVGTVESYCRTFLELALADPRFDDRLIDGLDLRAPR
jgi:UTP--glucose-1-phosphate uridylyltransferase